MWFCVYQKICKWEVTGVTTSKQTTQKILFQLVDSCSISVVCQTYYELPLHLWGRFLNKSVTIKTD